MAIRKIACFEDDSLQTDVRSPNSGMDGVDPYKVLRTPSIGIFAILVR
jgi:hypothetical protein